MTSNTVNAIAPLICGSEHTNQQQQLAITTGHTGPLLSFPSQAFFQTLASNITVECVNQLVQVGILKKEDTAQAKIDLMGKSKSFVFGAIKEVFQQKIQERMQEQLNTIEEKIQSTPFLAAPPQLYFLPLVPPTLAGGMPTGHYGGYIEVDAALADYLRIDRRQVEWAHFNQMLLHLMGAVADVRDSGRSFKLKKPIVREYVGSIIVKVISDSFGHNVFTLQDLLGKLEAMRMIKKC